MSKTNVPRSGLVPHAHEKDIVEAAINEILEVCKLYFDKPAINLKVLDMGSGNGDYSFELSKHFKTIVGVEPFPKGYKHSVENYKRTNLSFFNTQIENYSGKDKFDLVVSLTVFEHLPHPKKSFKKTFELLKKGGVIYLTAPNKYWLFEQHYGLPFLSWLPLPLANMYLKVFRGVNSYEDSSYSKSYFGMKKFFDQFSCEYKFILPFDPQGKYFGCNAGGTASSFVRNLGITLINIHPFFWNFSKGFIMVVKK